MPKLRPVQFRAVHTKNRWRPSDHETIKHALVGSSTTDKRSARALFDHRNDAISYSEEGEPKYVVIWLPGDDESGVLVKPDSSEADGLRKVKIGMETIESFEEGDIPTDAELERLFVLKPVVLETSAIQSLDDLRSDFELRLEASMFLSAAARARRLALADPVPPRVEVRTAVFVRNTDVVAEVLERAGGICQGCRVRAPFLLASTGEPYLEVHHKVQLSLGGPDTVENGLFAR